MAELWRGAPAAEALSLRASAQAEELRAAGITPTLAIVRVGERAEDLSYERGAVRRCEGTGVAVERFVLAQDAAQEELTDLLRRINGDRRIHGCLLLRPLPRQMDEKAVCAVLAPEKDIDGITPSSLAGVFTGSGAGFPPCTAQACMELLAHYGCDPAGKRAVVVGRSLVVGRPAAMLLMGQNATVTICHTKTANLAEECRRGDILLAAAGQPELIKAEHVRPGAVVLDVGIHSMDGKLTGDVESAAAEPVAGAITPVPGGVGAVTTCVLALHVIQAARRQNGLET